MIKQKDAVYNTVKQVLADFGMTHEDFTQLSISKEQRESCIGMLVHGFESGKIELESAQENIKSYTSGLLSNWLRKDKRFNGNVVYEPKHPGSRTGQADPMVKNLRILLGTLPEGSDAFTAVEAKINSRVAELKSDKNASKVKDIDFSCIPDDIKALLE